MKRRARRCYRTGAPARVSQFYRVLTQGGAHTGSAKGLGGEGHAAGGAAHPGAGKGLECLHCL